MILQVRKTWIKTAVTMDIGAFRAKEIVLECRADTRVFHSTQLRKLVPIHCTFEFDVIVAVGMALFVDCLNHQEIIQRMAAENVFISEREISYLGGESILYLPLPTEKPLLVEKDTFFLLMVPSDGIVLICFAVLMGYQN